MHHVKHPLISDLLVTIRDKNTSMQEFRRTLAEITTFLVIEATTDLPTTPVKVETPVAIAVGEKLQEPGPVLVPILRAGLGMSETARNLIPHSVEGQIGMKRNEDTALSEVYLDKLPSDLSNRLVIVTDPMLATGGSLIGAIDLIKSKGATQIRALVLVAAPEGIKAMEDAHPDVKIFVAAIDDHLNEKAYIVPGLGDAGDRQFGRLEDF